MKAVQLAVCGLLFALLCSVPVVAQSVYGGYSFVSVDTNQLTTPNRQSANGWETGANFALRPWLDIEGSIAGYYKTYPPFDLGYVSLVSPLKVHDISYGVGPRFNYRGIRSTMLFARALVGADRLTGSGTLTDNYGLGLSASGSVSQTSLATILGGGVERSIGHSQWAVRASADYVLTQHNLTPYTLESFTQHNFRASFGVAYWLGSHERGPVIPKPAKKETSAHCVGAQDVPSLGVSGCFKDDGFLVDAVHSGAARTAGINPGDTITQINGRSVSSAQEIEFTMGVAAGAKSAVKITYLIRGAWQHEIQLN
jgi:hypothetical protein